MPKEKKTTSGKLRQFVETFGSNILKTDGKVLFCIICEHNISSQRKSSIEQHISTIKHKTLEERKNSKKQLFVKESFLQGTSKKSEFNLELCRALVTSNIPFYKVQSPGFKSFFEKYTNKIIPDESTLRKNYLKCCYEETLEKIKSTVEGKKLWVSIDETTDIGNRYVANVIIGVLDGNIHSEIFLLNTVFLDKTNSSTVASLFEDSIKLLNNFDRHNILLFVTDAAPYMVKAAEALKVLYPNMLHLTCLAHGLSRICEKIRTIFPEVDVFISNLKKIFLKSPSRVDVFRSIAPSNLTLPPKPIITRWGTWLNSVLYSCKNYDVLSEVINSFDSSDKSACISVCKEIMLKESFKNDLSFIAINYGFICEIIKKLEQQNMPLVKSMDLISQTQEKIQDVMGEKAGIIKNYFDFILNKNKDLKTLNKIANIHSGHSNIDVHYSPHDVTLFKNAPITSCDVERSFSLYNNIVTDKRISFKEEHLKYYIITSCNTI